jgi:hypothetical protein
VHLVQTVAIFGYVYHLIFVWHISFSKSHSIQFNFYLAIHKIDLFVTFFYQLSKTDINYLFWQCDVNNVFDSVLPLDKRAVAAVLTVYSSYEVLNSAAFTRRQYRVICCLFFDSVSCIRGFEQCSHH